MERHELSELFGDMTELEFSEFISDVEHNGFAQPIIYTYEGKILDGWHRYQVAVNLDKVSELEFTALDGIQNPLGFAMGVNYFRRHMNASHRAVVKALAHETEWIDRGANRHTLDVQSCTPKTSAKMAAEVQVSKRTMDAAKKVVKLGLADEVIEQKKSVEQVLKEQDNAIGKRLDEVDKALTEIISDPEAVKKLSTDLKALKTLKEICVDYSLLTMDAERMIVSLET